MQPGYVIIILHAHLPFVRHPEYSTFLEEDWFYEALTESYIPILEVMEGLLQDSVDFRLTISLSPTLLAMMNDPLLQNRYITKLDSLIDLAYSELKRTRSQPKHNALAQYYYEKFVKTKELFIQKYRQNLIGVFKCFQDKGNLEIITTTATHAFLPLMNQNRNAIKAQIQVGIEYYKKFFNLNPHGFWLPECGFCSGLDAILNSFKLHYFFVETHGILHATPRPKYGVFAPVRCPSGIAVFGRDIESSKQVWSSHYGYPGDPNYRDFYRDIGYDLDYNYIKPYLHGDGSRVHTGIKYYRITGDDIEKQLYDPEAAHKKAAEHAKDFVTKRCNQISSLSNLLERSPVIVTPFDAELFGHWWHEGPQWLDCVLREFARQQHKCRIVTASEYLDSQPHIQTVAPSQSSWGWRGYNEAWLDTCNDWIYRHLHEASEYMVGLAGKFPHATGIMQRALSQAARELLLAQSSDWAFIMKTGTMTGYAHRRTVTHLSNFFHLHEAILKGSIEEKRLAELEYKHNVFPELDYRVYS